MPSKDMIKKDTMIQIIRKYIGIKDRLGETVKKYGYDTGESMDLWDRHYKRFNTDLHGILGTFKSLDPDIGAKKSFINARKNLETYYQDQDKLGPKIYYYGSVQENNLFSACDDIETLIGSIKADYNIMEDEIDTSKDLLKRLFSTKEERLDRVAEFRRIDIHAIEELMKKLNDVLAQSVEIKEGKVDLRFPISYIKRIYNEFKEELRYTQYVNRYDDAVVLSRGLDALKNEPEILIEHSKKFLNDLTIDIDQYHRRSRRKMDLREHL